MTTGINAGASADRVQLAYAAEDTFGDVSNSTPRFVRMQSESLNFDLTKETDKELNATAEQTSSTTVGAQAGGDVKVHMQYAEYDPWFAALLRSAWTEYGTNGVGAAFTADFAANSITADVAPVGPSAFTTLQPGQWFQVVAPGDANDGKLLRASSTVAPTATVIELDPNTPAIVSADVVGVTLSSSRLKNAVSLTSFSLERQIAEVGQFFTYRGCMPSKFSIELASRALTDGTFTFIGKDLIPPTATTNLNGAPTASNTYDIQNGVKGVGQIWEGGAPLAGTKIKRVSLDIDSGLRAQDALGELGLAGVGIGTFVVKGTLEVYFANGALFDKYLNDTYTSISFSTKDADGNGYVITLPRVQLTNGKVVAGGRNTDLMATFEYTAYRDVKNTVPALRATMLMDRFGAAVAP